MKTIGLLAIVLFTLSSGGCTKEGSEAWCAKMKDTPKGDWTANEAADFAKHCIIK